MAHYNRWMNSRIYAACAGLSDAERKRDAGAFFRSIHGTLNHLLLADRIWMGRFSGQAVAVESLDQELHSSFEALRAERETRDEAIIAWAESLSDADLASTLSFTSVVDPRPRECPFWLAVSHFFNHQTHHRGQVTTLLSQRGIDPGVTDLIRLGDFQPLPP